MASDLIERMRQFNPWAETDWPEVARKAADALAAQASEIERLKIERDMYKTSMEQSHKVLEDVEPRMYAAEARVSDLSPEVERLRRIADIQQRNADANYGLWKQEKARADALAARVAELENVLRQIEQWEPATQEITLAHQMADLARTALHPKTTAPAGEGGAS